MSFFCPDKDYTRRGALYLSKGLPLKPFFLYPLGKSLQVPFLLGGRDDPF